MLEAPREEATAEGGKRRKDNRRLTWCPGKAKLPTRKEEVEVEGAAGEKQPSAPPAFCSCRHSFLLRAVLPTLRDLHMDLCNLGRGRERARKCPLSCLGEAEPLDA